MRETTLDGLVEPPMIKLVCECDNNIVQGKINSYVRCQGTKRVFFTNEGFVIYIPPLRVCSVSYPISHHLTNVM